MAESDIERVAARLVRVCRLYVADPLNDRAGLVAMGQYDASNLIRDVIRELFR